ncbi:MAG: type II toxin-antitoxin system RelE/ParE family toxin [Proteobacteria bacterium]|nr:type II toxin-antitoxin system RelE/ParE family toxin [Pseudomonadota bacterium]
MKITFLEEAQHELDQAIDYYDSQSPDLGQQFLQEVLSTLDRIASFPQAWHPISENTRRCQTARFPYGLIYSVLENEILIISVSHLHREPSHWKHR